ncbi:hypothetical protein TNCV_1380551 [Trichonephila clavipes]|nr:hypothetical protein TNCV_1380551 [Trichonephila clavipes]
MAVMDRAATSQFIAQQIQSVTHHSLYSLTIRRHFQLSGMPTSHLLLLSPLLETTGVCAANGVMNGRRGPQEGNEIVFTDESRFHLHHDDRI